MLETILCLLAVLQFWWVVICSVAHVVCLGLEDSCNLPAAGNPSGSHMFQTHPCSTTNYMFVFSLVQWHPFFLSLFWVAAPLKMVFPKQGSFFASVTEQLSFDRDILNPRELPSCQTGYRSPRCIHDLACPPAYAKTGHAKPRALGPLLVFHGSKH